MRPETLENRHPSTKAIAAWFEYKHLPPPLQATSQQFHDLAANLIHDLPDSPELTAGLRKLLEAKDCFVRAATLINSEDIPYYLDRHEGNGKHERT